MGLLQKLLTAPSRLRGRFVSRRARKAEALTVVLAASSQSAADKFSEIYRQKLWVKAGAESGESESLSGHGSSVRSTQILRGELESLFAAQAPRAFFDAPCGDFHWMQNVRLPDGCAYIGGDIVESVIESNRRLYQRERTGASGSRTFEVFDITESRFPEADYWLCKDCLQHLSFADVKKALKNFAASGIEHALISNHEDVVANRDIDTGDFRHLDLTLAPFHLPKPSTVLKDHHVDRERERRVVAVWTRGEIAGAVSRF